MIIEDFAEGIRPFFERVADYEICKKRSKQLLTKLNKSIKTLYMVHYWGEARIDRIYKNAHENLSISVLRKCLKCGSKRKREIVYINNHTVASFWQMLTPDWFRSNIFESSVCYTRMKRRFKRLSNNEQKRVNCVCCGLTHLTLKSALACEKAWSGRHAEEQVNKNMAFKREYPNEQVRKNVLILKGGNIRKFTLRQQLAIYRLYRYCDMPPREIARITGHREQYIYGVIGDIFATLCLSSNSCVFKPMLKEAYELTEAKT